MRYDGGTGGAAFRLYNLTHSPGVSRGTWYRWLRDGHVATRRQVGRMNPVTVSGVGSSPDVAAEVAARKFSDRLAATPGFVLSHVALSIVGSGRSWTAVILVAGGPMALRGDG